MDLLLPSDIIRPDAGNMRENCGGSKLQLPSLLFIIVYRGDGCVVMGIYGTIIKFY